MSEYIHYLASCIETRNLTHIIRAVIDTNTSFLLFSFLLPFLYICSGEGPLKKRKGDKQRCLFYAKCNFFLVDGERLVCQRCSDAQGGQTSNGASLLPSLPINQGDVVDAAMQAQPAILNIIQKRKPA